MNTQRVMIYAYQNGKMYFQKYYEKDRMTKTNFLLPFCLLPFCPFTIQFPNQNLIYAYVLDFIIENLCILYFYIQSLASILLIAASVLGIIVLACPTLLENFLHQKSNVIGVTEIHRLLHLHGKYAIIKQNQHQFLANTFLCPTVSIQVASSALFLLYFICGISMGVLLLSGTERVSLCLAAYIILYVN